MYVCSTALRTFTKGSRIFYIVLLSCVIDVICDFSCFYDIHVSTLYKMNTTKYAQLNQLFFC